MRTTGEDTELALTTTNAGGATAATGEGSLQARDMWLMNVWCV